MLMLRATIACFIVASLPWDHAVAATPAEKKAARMFFDDGRKALEEQRYHEAVESFSKAEKLDPNPILKGFLARAYEDLGLSQTQAGDLKAARQSYRLARDNYATLAVDPAASGSARDKARLRVPRIEATLVDLDKAIAAREATRTVLEAPEGDPGTSVTPTDPAGDVASGSHLEPVPAEPGPDLVLPGAITLGAGAVLAGIGVLAMVDAEDKRSQVKDAETNAAGQITSVTQVGARTLEEDANTNATLGVIGLSVGAAAIVAGTVMILISDDDEPVTRRHTTIGAATDGDRFMLTAMGHF